MSPVNKLILSIGENEAQYLYLLRDCPSLRLYEICRIVGHEKSNAYNRLINLREKGFVIQNGFEWDLTNIGNEICVFLDKLLFSEIATKDGAEK